MPRYQLTVAYDGTHFHGWQKQQRGESNDQSLSSDPQSPDIPIPGTEPADVPGIHEPLRTVQGVLENTIRKVIREPVIVTGASRTDAGVHARGQCAAFTSQTDIPVEKLPRAISSRLPPDVQVIDAKIVHEEFDPIRDALAKCYRYRIAHSCASHRRPLFDRHFITHTAYTLDPARMNAAARLMLGEHDFASFARINHGRDTTVRTVYDCLVAQTSKRRCHIDIAGNGFLYNMVRIIAGTLVEIGRGVREPDSMLEALAAKNRDGAGPTMPPEGLCLMWIKYPEIAVTPPAPAACPA